jgi:hypothetical protein
LRHPNSMKKLNPMPASASKKKLAKSEKEFEVQGD